MKPQRRARTDGTIRHNRIYDIRILRDGQYVSRVAAHYARKHDGGRTVTTVL